MRNKIKSFRGESFPASKHSPEHKAAVPENQGVTRVKGVAEILEPLSMIPLPPLVQPNQRQGQHRKSLLRDFESEHGNEDRRNKECIQDNQENELHGKTRGRPLAEKIKHQHHQDAGAAVIRRQGLAQKEPKHNPDNQHHLEPLAGVTAVLFRRPHQKESNQERPEDVLMGKVHQPPAAHQVKRRFRY